MFNKLSCLFIEFIVLAIIAVVNFPEIGNETKAAYLKIMDGPQPANVAQLHLIDKLPLAKDIIANNAGYFKETHLRNFNQTILGYVTPWNKGGYKITEIFGSKFNIISPVWFQINKENQQYIIAGLDAVDYVWLKNIKKKYNSLEIFPRFIFEKFSNQDFVQLINYADERAKLCKAILQICSEYKFDGIVLELWTQLSHIIDKRYLSDIVKDISRMLKTKQLKTILVIPPYRRSMPKLFTENDFNNLHEYVHAFSLMTYDYSSSPGPNAPLHWIETSIENVVPAKCKDYAKKRKQILMGLNMYGSLYTSKGGKAITGEHYLKLLPHIVDQFIFDKHSEEHYFQIKNSDEGDGYVFYPSLYSIQRRLSLAKTMGVGLSLWELGQGLNYFYDLL